MKYSSRKFFRTKEKDQVLLYFMAILTLVQIFYLVMHKKYKLIVFFFIFGMVLSFFIKNQSIVLILSIIMVNILLNVKKHEGLAIKDIKVPVAKDTPETTETPEPPEPKQPKKNSKGVSKNASSVTAPTTLDPKENFDGTYIGKKDKSGQIDQVGKHIESLNTLMDKFSGLTTKFNLFGK